MAKNKKRKLQNVDASGKPYSKSKLPGIKERIEARYSTKIAEFNHYSETDLKKMEQCKLSSTDKAALKFVMKQKGIKENDGD